MWLRDLRIILPEGILERGCVRIQDGKIAEVVEGCATCPDAEQSIDGKGLTAVPGIVDLHGDMLEREIEPRPGARFPLEMAVYELDKRLAAAGVTTAFATISFAAYRDKDELRSCERAREMADMVTRLREALLVEVLIHARFDINNVSAVPILKEMFAARQVDLVSLNDHTPGQGQYRDLVAYVEFMAKWRKISIEEAERAAAERIRMAEEAPPSWAVASEVASLAGQLGLTVASHDDDTEAKVRFVAGLGVTISEFPVTMEAAIEAKRHGMYVAMGAPNVLQGYSHVGNLSAVTALEAGLVDVLVADYHPATLLQAAFLMARNGLLPLHEAVKLISENPARAAGLAGRGRIEAGNAADIVLVQGETAPRVRASFRSGVPIYWDRAMVGRVRSGRSLQPV